MVFLSFLHFFFTFLGTRVLLWKEVFPYKAAQSNFIMPLSILSLLSVAFMNLNLKRNSVGFYQLSKLACIPVTLSIEYLAYNKTISRLVQMTLIPILFGVGFATIYDLDINMIGSIFATVAVLATATSQIYLKQIQKPLDCSPLQILYHTSPLVCLGMLMLVPFFDNYKEIMEFEFTVGCVFRIGLSCVFALGVNISNYLVIGKTSPLTYQVLGHLKTILILILGFLFFNKVLDYRNVIGIVVAMVGVIAYTEINRRMADISKETLPSTLKQNES
jgi:solute carrier family 35 protein E3